MIYFELADALNGHFRVGCQTFTRQEVLAYGGRKLSRIAKCLYAWESKGLIQVLKPLNRAQDGEFIIKVLHAIEDQRQTQTEINQTADLPVGMKTTMENDVESRMW